MGVVIGETAEIGNDVTLYHGVTLGGTASGAFANKNVGTAKAIAVTGHTLSGADAGNYTLVEQSGLTADITKANLVVTGLTASGKTYDTTTTASLGGTAAVSALAGDTVYAWSEVLDKATPAAWEGSGVGALRKTLDNGYRGTAYDFISAVTVTDETGEPSIVYTLDTQRARAMWGLSRTLVDNMVTGVTTQRPIMMRPELEYVSWPGPNDGRRSMFGILSADTTMPVEPVSITTA